MNLEQPPFDTEKKEQKPSNVIEGPWMKKQRVQEEAEISQRIEDFLEASKEREAHQVIEVEGLWPKKEAEQAEAVPELEPIEIPAEDMPLEIPEGAPPMEVPVEPVPGTEEAQIKDARQDLQAAFDQQEQENSELVGSEEDDQKKNRSSGEIFTTYKPCEACNGRKRLWLFFPCPVCKGRGSVPDKTYDKWRAVPV